jgi:acyl-coenzyme A synthetase/AMP-(fatty) acid ligase
MKLITGHGLDDVLAWRASGPVRVREFLGDALALARLLPDGPAVFNLCEDRYRFAILFAACLLTRKTSLQPSSQTPQVLRGLAREYPGSYVVTDQPREPDGLASWVMPPPDSWQRPPVSAVPDIDPEFVAAILFTSGSTGLPQPHAKHWGRLVLNGQAEARALGLDRQPHALVGTVPVQHSYGFESTFLLALHGGCSFWCGKPFYPQDVVEAIAAVPEPRMLVSTPYHLATLLAAGLEWPALDMCLSATAPMGAELAGRIEQHARAPVLEIYGSTESGQLATRRTVEGPVWELMPGVRLIQEGDVTSASGGHVEGCVPLSDVIECMDASRFVLHGRHADMVNIAGRRSSLAYLNHQLCAVQGVRDGAFFLPDADGHEAAGGFTRLMAFVVLEPGAQPGDVMAALRGCTDSVFLPRPLVVVEALPRNGTGKLPRGALAQLYDERVLHARA